MQGSLVLAWTENSVVPLPLRPLLSVTSMSNFATAAVSATSMVATSLFEPWTTTFVTVTPPVSVVPATRNLALAVLLNPLPLTVT